MGLAHARILLVLYVIMDFLVIIHAIYVKMVIIGQIMNVYAI
jgi:hypothetical protein